ncbi:MAG TPA: hypothetical protein VHI52_18260 [Verrucomicrobiae bacterium]|nr:hypothetical protein [Verrucomicrobiae bacterium]
MLLGVALCLLVSCGDTSPSDRKDMSDWKVVNTIASPNGDYVATIYTVMGGGAAGWCEQRVEVNSKTNAFDLNRAKKGADYCFSADCGSRVEMVWEPDNSALRITYTVGPPGVSTYQRRMAPGLPIRIDYGIR